MLEYPGTDLNRTDEDGNTALHHAVTYDHLKLTYLFLMKGADSEIKNNLGCKPIDIAKADKNESILHFFVIL